MLRIRNGLFLFPVFILSFLLLLGGQGIAAVDETAVCLLDGNGERSTNMPNCATETSVNGANLANAATGKLGVRLNPNASGAKTPIDVHGKCRFLDNNSAESYFVPFSTAAEWAGFDVTPVAGVTKTHCALPFNGQDSSRGLRYGPTTARPDLGDTGGQYANVNLPYWRTRSTWPASGQVTHTFNLQCTRPSGCATYSWQEVFSFTATAGDSDVGSPSWTGVSRRISGPSARPAICSQSCCTPSKCKVCNSSGVKVNARNGTRCGSAWCINGRCQAFFWDVCSGRAGYARCYKSPTNGSRSGYITDRPCSSCPAGQTTGRDSCQVCPNVWGSGRAGEWSHVRYF